MLKTYRSFAYSCAGVATVSKRPGQDPRSSNEAIQHLSSGEMVSPCRSAASKLGSLGYQGRPQLPDANPGTTNTVIEESNSPLTRWLLGTDSGNVFKHCVGYGIA